MIEGIFLDARHDTERNRDAQRLDQLTKFISHDSPNLLSGDFGNRELVSFEVEDERLKPIADAVDAVPHMISDIGQLAEVDEIRQ